MIAYGVRIDRPGVSLVVWSLPGGGSSTGSGHRAHFGASRPYTAFAVLGGLLVLLGSRFRGMAAEDDSRSFRLAQGALAGVLVFYLTLSVLDVLRISWRPTVLIVLLGAATISVQYTSRLRRGQRSLARGERFGWGGAVALAAFAAFAWLSVSLRIVTPDFYFHWGLKGERFFLARGTDFAFLAMPWNIPINPHYPTLLPDLYAATALFGWQLRGERHMMLWSVACFRPDAGSVPRGRAQSEGASSLRPRQPLP